MKWAVALLNHQHHKHVEKIFDHFLYVNILTDLGAQMILFSLLLVVCNFEYDLFIYLSLDGYHLPILRQIWALFMPVFCRSFCSKTVYFHKSQSIT